MIGLNIFIGSPIKISSKMGKTTNMTLHPSHSVIFLGVCTTQQRFIAKGLTNKRHRHKKILVLIDTNHYGFYFSTR